MMREPTKLDALIEDYRRLAEKASAGMNERCVQNFNEAVAKADALADECEIRRVIRDCWGNRTWMIEVPRG